MKESDGTELSKLKLDNKLDILLAISILECRLHDGWACDKCGIIQGEPRKGFKKYYCKCIGDKIDRRLLKYNKKIAQDVFKHTIETGGRFEGELNKKQGEKRK